MALRKSRGYILPIAAVLLLGVPLASCSGFLVHRTEGYVITQDSLKQIRTGQSAELVSAVLGSPQTKGTFTNETAWYYIETKVQETAFGLRNVTDRTVLAVYFDANMRVKDKAVYGLKDGKAVTIETRRTPSFGEDRTFVESILQSFSS